MALYTSHYLFMFDYICFYLFRGVALKTIYTACFVFRLSTYSHFVTLNASSYDRMLFFAVIFEPDMAFVAITLARKNCYRQNR
jgi:hypothetical protein